MTPHAFASPSPPSSYQDDAINLSWHHQYVPYMVRQEERRKNPRLDDELAELGDSFEEVDRHYYSAILESLKDEYRKANPDAPDPDAELQAEYEAYMAAHPGLAERLAREEEDYTRRNTFSTIDELQELIATAERLELEEGTRSV